MAFSSNVAQRREWLIPTLWGALGLLLLSLLGMAIYLLVKMDFFSGNALTDEQLKSLWAFLGVAVGAVVTLIGTLLTEQHNRRTVALTREASAREQIARENQEALAKQAEKRLTIDTVAKTLELITDGGQYAQRARVSGAIATMMELQGGAVAIRILGEVWRADAVDGDTAIWLINRVLSQSTETDEIEAAADLLSVNTDKLIPKQDDPEQDWRLWPAALEDSWPEHISSDARNSLVIMACRLLLRREIEYWKRFIVEPVSMLVPALDDQEYRGMAAHILLVLLDSGALDTLNAVPDVDVDEMRSWSEEWTPAPWFAELLDKFGPWARGEAIGAVMTTATSPPATVRDESPTKA